MAADFDGEGQLVIRYSNGETEVLHQLALATTRDPNTLVRVGDSMFSAPGDVKLDFGHAGAGRFGQIEAGSLELSNVEMSKEFAEIIIVQRGYQASSQVMNVANEMIQELYNSVRG